MTLDASIIIGAKLRLVGLGLELEANGDALHHLHPVAGRVLRGEGTELRAGAGADALHLGDEIDAGIGVDADMRFLARLHIGEVGLLQIRVDPEIVVRNQAEGRTAGGEIGAGTDIVDLAHDTVAGRDDGRAA